MPLKRITIGRSTREPASMSAAAAEAISLSWESPPVAEVGRDERDDLQEVETLGGSAAVRKRRAQALVAEWRGGEVPAGRRIRRMLENGDGETRLALVEALPNAVPFEVVESALQGMGQSFLGGSAQTERRGWTVVTALLGAGLFLDLLIALNLGRGYANPSSVTLAVILATSPGLVAWQVMCIHRRIQMAIDTQRQGQYYARVAMIAKASLHRDPSQYAQPVLHRLEEMAPVVDLEGGATKKVYRQTVRVFQDAVAHLRSLPIATETSPIGADSLPLPSAATDETGEGSL